MRFERKVWLRYSLEAGYRKTRSQLMEATRDIRKSKRKLNEDKRDIEKKILEEATTPEELRSLREERTKLLQGISELQKQYDKVAGPYRARLQKYRNHLKYLDEVIIKDLQTAYGLEVKPIELEEAERLLQAIKSDLKSEEVKSDNGGGTGKA